MKAIADLQVIPIGAGVSVRREVMRIVEILKEYDFKIQHHAAGTNLEGELDDLLEAVKQVHEMMHEEGTVRLVSYLKLETRTNKEPTLEGKKL